MPRPTRREASRRGPPRGLAAPRLLELDADVASGFDKSLDACRRLGAEIVDAPRPDCPTP